MKAAAPQNGASAAIRPYHLFSRGAAAPTARLAAPPFPLGRDGSPSGPIFAAQASLSRQSVLEKINDFRWLLSRILNVNFC